MIKGEWVNILKLALSVLIVLIGSLAFGLLAEKFFLLKVIDASVYSFFRNFPHNKLVDLLIWPFDNNFIPLFRPHPSFLVIIYSAFLLYLGIFKRNLFFWALLALLIATLIARLILQIDTALFFRDRPYTLLPNDVSDVIKNGLKGWTSYPSGHTRDTAIYATIISFFLPKMWPVLALVVIFVGFSRMYLGIHYFTDVLAGGAIGLSVGLITIESLRTLRRMRGEKPIV